MEDLHITPSKLGDKISSHKFFHVNEKEHTTDSQTTQLVSVSLGGEAKGRQLVSYSPGNKGTSKPPTHWKAQANLRRQLKESYSICRQMQGNHDTVKGLGPYGSQTPKFPSKTEEKLLEIRSKFTKSRIKRPRNIQINVGKESRIGIFRRHEAIHMYFFSFLKAFCKNKMHRAFLKHENAALAYLYLLQA